MTIAAWAAVPGELLFAEPLVTRAMRGPTADVAVLLMSGAESGSLEVAALAVPRPGAGAAAAGIPVDLWVEVDGISLLGEEEPEVPRESVRLELHVYAMSRARELAGTLSRQVRLPLATLGDEIREGGVKLQGRLELPPGEYQLRILVREPASQRFKLRFTTVVVPAVSDPGNEAAAVAPSLLPSVFAGAPGAWVEVRHGAPGEEGSHPAPGSPSALPVLAAGTSRSLELRGRGLEASALALRLLEVGGALAAELAADFGAIESSVLDRVAVTVHLPAELAPGTYLLEAAAGEARSVLPVFVLPAGVRGEGATWPVIDRLALEPRAETGSTREGVVALNARRARGRVAAIASAYRDVLALLATGSTTGAVEALVELETGVVRQAPGEGHEWLAAAEARVIAELARRDPEALVPVLLLHLESHRSHVAARVDTFLILATRERILELARDYARLSASDQAPVVAAAALADLGVAVDRAGMPETGRRLLDEALALDDENTAVLTYLAYWHERRGRYGDAAETLERLLAVAPRSAEGRLRRAICWRRLGRAAEAEAQLRQVIQEGSSEIALTIAYQELGRILLADGRAVEGAEWVRAGVARWPAQQRLRVQLSYLLERAGQEAESREVLRDLPADAGRPSPRHLYSRRPSGVDGDARQELVRQANARLPLLSSVLASGKEVP